MDVRSLETDGFAVIKYPAHLRACVHAAMAAWQGFCALPLDQKLLLSNQDRHSDFGYMVRDGKGQQEDRKEMFHLSRRNIGEVLERASRISDPRALTHIEAIDSLIAAIRETISDFSHSVEAEYAIPGLAQDVLNNSDGWTFRFLHYLGGEMLAHPHADKGGITLHLDESDPGGEYLDFTGQWRPWPISHDQTIIFPSVKLQHRSQGRLKALCHRVTTTPKTRQHGRFALVAFANFAWTHRFNNDKYPHSQQLAPGYNYNISSADFEDYLIPV